MVHPAFFYLLEIHYSTKNFCKEIKRKNGKLYTNLE